MTKQKSHIWKSLVPEIWAKMDLANQIEGFLNNPHLMSKLMKYSGFLHGNSKIGCNSRINGWIELFFCMMIQIQES